MSDKFKTLSSDQIAAMECEFSEEEIKQVVWSCDGSKALDPDGLTMNLDKNNCELLKSDIVAAIKDFEISGRLPRGCNSAFITLIPKVPDPQIIS